LDPTIKERKGKVEKKEKKLIEGGRGFIFQMRRDQRDAARKEREKHPEGRERWGSFNGKESAPGFGRDTRSPLMG